MQIRVVADSRRAYRPLMAIVAVFMLLLMLFQVDISSREDWRRTAHGWEHSGAWLVAAASLQKPTMELPANSRFDTHPVALAFAELVSTLLALFAAASNAERAQHRGLLSAIAKSFRASVFGS